ncbi:MAG: aminotransferase class V-fold PLP-dependent enzyme [Eubacteriales bacterium]
MIYFNNSSTTLVKPDVVYEAFVNASKTLSNMGRGSSNLSIETSRAVFDAREKVASFFHIKNPMRVGFTKNATEALNTGLYGLLGAGDHVIASVCEHNSVLRPLYRMEKEQGLEITLIRCGSMGEIDPEDFRKAIKPNTKMIVATHVSNVTGTVIDIASIGAIAKEKGLAFFVDAAQSAGVLDIDVQRDNIDLLAFTAHKYLYCLQGLGGLYVRDGVKIRPLMLGGGASGSLVLPDLDMPESTEAGTVNMPCIAALGSAVDFICANKEAIQKKESELTDYFLQRIREISFVKVLGRQENKDRVALFSLVSAEYTLQDIAAFVEENNGIVVRTGLQCAPLIHPYIGSAKEGTLRISMSYFNEKKEIDVLMEALHAFPKHG